MYFSSLKRAVGDDYEMGGNAQSWVQAAEEISEICSACEKTYYSPSQNMADLPCSEELGFLPLSIDFICLQGEIRNLVTMRDSRDLGWCGMGLACRVRLT